MKKILVYCLMIVSLFLFICADVDGCRDEMEIKQLEKSRAAERGEIIRNVKIFSFDGDLLQEYCGYINIEDAETDGFIVIMEKDSDGIYRKNMFYTSN